MIITFCDKQERTLYQLDLVNVGDDTLSYPVTSDVRSIRISKGGSMAVGDLVEWQKIDPENGLVMPWYTHDSLAEIASWDLSEKVVLEWGGGGSTLWWAKKAKHVFTIEVDKEWCGWIEKRATELGLSSKLSLFHRSHEPVAPYLEIPSDCRPDIVVVDGSERLACIERVLDLPRPLTLIVDNWQQDGVFISERAEMLLSSFSQHIHLQKDHKDHHGRPWQTGIFFIR